MSVHYSDGSADLAELGALARQWHDAIEPVILRHPNGRSRVILRLIDGDPPALYVGLDETTCTLNGAVKRDFAISTVSLTFFPGETLARQWIAAAWAGYCQHEALELATVGDLATKILDPHAEPYATNPYNRGLRDGLPTELTPETLCKALCVVMDEGGAGPLMRAAGARLSYDYDTGEGVDVGWPEKTGR